MPGPAPTPTALRVIRGAMTGRDPSHRPLPANEPHPRPVLPGEMPRCPIKLSAEERRWWRYYVRTFSECGVLTHNDLVALAGIAVLTARWVQYCEQLKKAGPVFVHRKKVKAGKDEDGNPIYETVSYPIVSPFLSVEQATWTQLQKALEQFGATPASRTRVQAAASEASSGNPFARFDKGA